MATTSGVKRVREDSDDERMDVATRSDRGGSGGGMGPSGPDGRFISLRAPSFRIRTTRRLLNTIKQGQFFWPLYQYMLPYAMSLKSGSPAKYGPINQAVDYLISRSTPLFHQVTNFKTSMRISHIQSNVAVAAGATEMDTVAGNNSPYLNIGRDSLGVYKSLPCGPYTSLTWDEAALRGNTVYGCMHNGGVYTSTLSTAGSAADELLDFGSQAPYSMFGDVQTLQSGGGSSYSKHNHYQAPDGHAFVVPSMKKDLATQFETVDPISVVRFPFPSTQVSPVNTSNTSTGSNPPATGDSVLRTSDDISKINLNNGGEAICLWVNPINPDLDATATSSQALNINFMMELTMECDVKVNYSPATIGDPADNPLFTDGYLTQGKVVAMPCQATPTADERAYWIFGDALRPTHRNNL